MPEASRFRWTGQHDLTGRQGSLLKKVGSSLRLYRAATTQRLEPSLTTVHWFSTESGQPLRHLDHGDEILIDLAASTKSCELRAHESG
jgi:hypothetical protein